MVDGGVRLLVIVFLMPAVLIGCQDAGARAKTTGAPDPSDVRLSSDLLSSGQVRIEPVAASVEPIIIRTSGKATFNEEHLSYISSPLVGRVTSLRVRPGERVAAGQTLAVIDSADLGSAFSEYIKGCADLVLAERNHRLARELLSAKAMARKEVQKAEDEFVKAKADRRRTRERLVSLGVEESELDQPLDTLHVRSQFNLSSPIGGTVVERTVTLGQIVGGDTAARLFVIADLGTLWVTADVYEKDLSLVRPGDEVRIRAAAWPDEEFIGHINYIGDVVDPSSRTVKVRATVENPQQHLKPEMFVTATVYTAANATVTTVPLAAVHGEGTGQPYVFTVTDGNRLLRRQVTLGNKSDDHVAVTAGLSTTDRVVTEGSILLKAEAERQADG